MTTSNVERTECYSDDHSVIRLAEADQSFIGMALRAVPDRDRLLRAADEIATHEFHNNKRLNTPDQLPFPNPWAYLRGAPVVPENLKNVFCAAESQLYAWRHLYGIACGRASVETDWDRVLVNAFNDGDSAVFQHAFHKVVDGELLSGFSKIDDPNISTEWRMILKERRAVLAQRGQIARLRNAPERIDVQQAYHLVADWIRITGSDLPGLMFWSNRAIAKFLLVKLGKPSDYEKHGSEFTKSLRQNMGLIPADKTDPIIWRSKIERHAGGFSVTLFSRDGERRYVTRVTKVK